MYKTWNNIPDHSAFYQLRTLKTRSVQTAWRASSVSVSSFRHLNSPHPMSKRNSWGNDQSISSPCQENHFWFTKLKDFYLKIQNNRLSRYVTGMKLSRTSERLSRFQETQHLFLFLFYTRKFLKEAENLFNAWVNIEKFFFMSNFYAHFASFSSDGIVSTSHATIHR